MADLVNAVYTIQDSTTDAAYPNALVFTIEGDEPFMYVVDGLAEALEILRANGAGTKPQRLATADAILRGSLLPPQAARPTVRLGGWIAEGCLQTLVAFMPHHETFREAFSDLRPRCDAFVLPTEAETLESGLAIFRDDAGYCVEVFHAKDQGFDLLARFDAVLGDDERKIYSQGLLGAVMPASSPRAPVSFGGYAAGLLGTALYLPKLIGLRP